MTGKEYEGTSPRRINQTNGLVDHRSHVTGGRRFRHSNRQIQQALTLVVERAVDLQSGDVSEPEAAGEVTEVLAEGQRRRREHPGTPPRLQHRLEAGGNVERHETQREAALAGLDR